MRKVGINPVLHEWKFATVEWMAGASRVPISREVLGIGQLGAFCRSEADTTHNLSVFL